MNRRWPAGPVRVEVPATSANLGPGFDSLGLALALHDRVTARVAGTGLSIEVSGVGPETAVLGERHLVVRAMRSGFARIGASPPGLEISCQNEIPHGFGLGSSAGAIAAGLLASRALAGDEGLAALPDALLLREAVRLEGHADNVAACLSGGLTIAWSSADGVDCVRLDPSPVLVPVVCLPADPVPTEQARAVLPAQVPLRDAAANSARSALLVAALTGGRTDLLMDATRDYLHQEHRAAAMPVTARLLARLRDSGIPAVMSGAGPSVLALLVNGTGPSTADVIAVAESQEAGWRVRELAVAPSGATASYTELSVLLRIWVRCRTRRSSHRR